MDFIRILLSGVLLLLALAVFFRLVRAYLEHKQEKNRRQQGSRRLILKDESDELGCLLPGLTMIGLILIYGGLFPPLDFQQSASPIWGAWLYSAALLWCLHRIVRWAFGSSKNNASIYLVLDQAGIRNIQQGKAITDICWLNPWKLKQYAYAQAKRSSQFHENIVEHALLLELSQKGKRLLFRFESTGEEVGGLPEFERKHVPYQIPNGNQWLKVEIMRRAGIDGDQQMSESSSFDQLPADPALMKAFDFNQQDLLRNRQGMCPARQVSSDLHSSGGNTIGFFVVMLVFAGLSAQQIWEAAAGGSANSDGYILGGFLLFLALFCLSIGMAAFDEYRNGYHIKRVQGKITLERYEGSGQCWLRIGTTGIPVSAAQYALFEDKAHYTAYFIDPLLSNRILVSIEKEAKHR